MPNYAISTVCVMEKTVVTECFPNIYKTIISVTLSSFWVNKSLCGKITRDTLALTVKVCWMQNRENVHKKNEKSFTKYLTFNPINI